MSKVYIEEILGRSLGQCDIETGDLRLYYVEGEAGIIWSFYFDLEDICFEIRLDCKENEATRLIINLHGKYTVINKDTPFDTLVSTLAELGLDWFFDVKRMYFQTACLNLANGLRLFFAFGEKADRDYGIFSFTFLLETHSYNIRE